MTKTIKRLCLRIALGDDYEYAVRTLNHDRRLLNAHTVDIMVRKDGVERFTEGDWLKRLARLVQGRQKPLVEL